jgi:hypothetical protein
MAGRGTISVNQTKQYGDQQLLDSMKATTTTPMTGVPIPAPSAGRPPGSSSTSPAGPGGPSSQDIDPAHMSKMDELALAARVKQYWDAIAAQYPSSWSRMYAADADENYQRIAHEMRSLTPFFS